MLLTTIDLHPADHRASRTLARLAIAQIGRNAMLQYAYVWWLYEPPSELSAGVDEAGIIRGWDRHKAASALVAAVLADAFEPRDRPLTPEAEKLIAEWRRSLITGA